MQQAEKGVRGKGRQPLSPPAAKSSGQRNALPKRSISRIHIGAVRTNEEWRISVTDNGIGIDPKYHQLIFEVFKRLHGASHPGSGIGLAICRRVIERHGGRIWIESQLGQGATFHFTLKAGETLIPKATPNRS